MRKSTILELKYPKQSCLAISWYPRNFTNPDLNYLDQYVRISDDALYSVQLGLYVIGYREYKDDQVSGTRATRKAAFLNCDRFLAQKVPARSSRYLPPRQLL